MENLMSRSSRVPTDLTWSVVRSLLTVFAHCQKDLTVSYSRLRGPYLCLEVLSPELSSDPPVEEKHSGVSLQYRPL